MRTWLTLPVALLAAVMAMAATPPATIPTFASETPVPPPDYGDRANWAALPDAPGAAARLPQGYRAAARPEVDVFFVHPTTLGPTRWTQDLADPAERARTDAVSIVRQATAFAGCCRIFAPRYRQASSWAYAARAGGREAEGDQAYALALDDVVRAFDWYVAHANQGRPFILAGHSQGAGQIMRLIGARITGTPLARRMVAAYAIGVPLTEASRASMMPDIPVCARPTATGCVIVWNSFAAGSDTTGYRARAADFARSRGLSGDPGVVCVNPLTFDARHPAGARGAARGALLGKIGDTGPEAVQRQAVAADCRDGILHVDTRALQRPPLTLPGGNLHNDDIALFWGDIWADATRRAQAASR